MTVSVWYWVASELSWFRMAVKGFNIRRATFADAAALAKVHVETFIEAHGASPETAPKYPLRLMQWSSIFIKNDRGDFSFVIEKDGGDVVGFARGIEPEEGTDALLNKIYIYRKYHGLGLGRELLLTVAEEFLKRGFSQMHLFGEADNPSNGFYEKMGAEKTFAENGEFHGGYRWNDLSKLSSAHSV